MGQNRGNTGANVLVLADGDLANQHARNVGDGILRPGIVDTRPNSQLAGPRSALGSIGRMLPSRSQGHEREEE